MNRRKAMFVFYIPESMYDEAIRILRALSSQNLMITL